MYIRSTRQTLKDSTGWSFSPSVEEDALFHFTEGEGDLFSIVIDIDAELYLVVKAVACLLNVQNLMT